MRSLPPECGSPEAPVIKDRRSTVARARYGSRWTQKKHWARNTARATAGREKERKSLRHGVQRMSAVKAHALRRG